MAYGTVRGTGKTVAAGRGEVIVELGLSTDGTGAPAKDAYYAAESGVTAHVCTRATKTPNFLGPFWFHESVFESWDVAT